MTQTLTSCSRRWPRNGLTLIEVTAGILLLSTLLVASIVAFEQHVRQIKRARRTVSAVQAADELLSEWFASGVYVPRQGEGRVRNDESFQWRTNVVGSGQNDALAWQVVRLQVSDIEAFDTGSALAEVDVVVPGGWPSQAVP